jgi:hypothetical protein
MSFFIYPIPNSGYWIDEAYNLCDEWGNLYTQDELTVPLEYALDSRPTLRKRQMPSYTNIPPPPVVSNWNQIQWNWVDGGMTYGILGLYLFVKDGLGNIHSATSATSSGEVLYCKSDVVQRMKRSVQASPLRMGTAKGPMGPMPTTGLPTTLFRSFPRV